MSMATSWPKVLFPSNSGANVTTLLDATQDHRNVSEKLSGAMGYTTLGWAHLEDCVETLGREIARQPASRMQIGRAQSLVFGGDSRQSRGN